MPGLSQRRRSLCRQLFQSAEGLAEVGLVGRQREGPTSIHPGERAFDGRRYHAAPVVEIERCSELAMFSTGEANVPREIVPRQERSQLPPHRVEIEIEPCPHTTVEWTAFNSDLAADQRAVRAQPEADRQRSLGTSETHFAVFSPVHPRIVADSSACRLIEEQLGARAGAALFEDVARFGAVRSWAYVAGVPARGSVRLMDGSTREMPLAELCPVSRKWGRSGRFECVATDT